MITFPVTRGHGQGERRRRREGLETHATDRLKEQGRQAIGGGVSYYYYCTTTTTTTCGGVSSMPAYLTLSVGSWKASVM